MTCAKATVRCTIVAPNGDHFVGENSCANPQPVCPRKPGEDYTKCTTICRQDGHAEIVALRLAGPAAFGARAFLEQHSYACRNCQEALFRAGVDALSLGAPR